MAADLKVQTSSASNLYLLRKDMSGWARNRAVRATVGDLSDEERQELWECYQAVTLDGKEMDWVGLTKAADAVLGPGNYSTSKLRVALQQMDLNRNGTINWYEFRAYMSANWSACKSAEHIMNSQDCEEDMITVDGKTRVVDLIKHYRRRVLMECVLKGQTHGFTQYKSQQYDIDGGSMPQFISRSRRTTEDSFCVPAAHRDSYTGHSASVQDTNLDNELADIASGPSLYQQVLGGTALAFDLSTKGGLDCSGACPTGGRRSFDASATPASPAICLKQREKRQVGKSMSFRHHRASSGFSPLHDPLDRLESGQLLPPDLDILNTRDSVCPTPYSELDSLTEFMGTNSSAYSQALHGSVSRRLPPRRAPNLGKSMSGTQTTSFRHRQSSGTGLSFQQETALNAALHPVCAGKDGVANKGTQHDPHAASSNSKITCTHSLPSSPAMGDLQNTSKLESAVHKVGTFFNKVSSVLFHPNAVADKATHATHSGVDTPNHPSLSAGGALITAAPKPHASATGMAMERAKSFNGLYSNTTARGGVSMKPARSFARDDAKWH